MWGVQESKNIFFQISFFILKIIFHYEIYYIFNNKETIIIPRAHSVLLHLHFEAYFFSPLQISSKFFFSQISLHSSDQIISEFYCISEFLSPSFCLLDFSNYSCNFFKILCSAIFASASRQHINIFSLNQFSICNKSCFSFDKFFFCSWECNWKSCGLFLIFHYQNVVELMINVFE